MALSRRRGRRKHHHRRQTADDKSACASRAACGTDAGTPTYHRPTRAAVAASHVPHLIVAVHPLAPAKLQAAGAARATSATRPLRRSGECRCATPPSPPKRTTRASRGASTASRGARRPRALSTECGGRATFGRSFLLQSRAWITDNAPTDTATRRRCWPRPRDSRCVRRATASPTPSRAPSPFALHGQVPARLQPVQPVRPYCLALGAGERAERASACHRPKARWRAGRESCERPTECARGAR